MAAKCVLNSRFMRMSLPTDWCRLMMMMTQTDDWCWHTVGPHQQGFVSKKAKQKKTSLKSTCKTVYIQVNFIKYLLDVSDDYARSTAKSQFWYLDSDNTTVTADDSTNSVIRPRGLLSHAGTPVEALIPLINCYSFFEELSDKLFAGPI